MDAIQKSKRQDLVRLVARLREYGFETTSIPPLPGYAVMDELLKKHNVHPLFWTDLPAPMQRVYRERDSLMFQIDLLLRKEKRNYEEEVDHQSLVVQLEYVLDIITEWLFNYTQDHKVLFQATGGRDSFAVLGGQWRLYFIAAKDMKIILPYFR